MKTEKYLVDEWCSQNQIQNLFLKNPKNIPPSQFPYCLYEIDFASARAQSARAEFCVVLLFVQFFV